MSNKLPIMTSEERLELVRKEYKELTDGIIKINIDDGLQEILTLVMQFIKNVDYLLTDDKT